MISCAAQSNVLHAAQQLLDLAYPANWFKQDCWRSNPSQDLGCHKEHIAPVSTATPGACFHDFPDILNFLDSNIPGQKILSKKNIAHP